MVAFSDCFDKRELINRIECTDENNVYRLPSQVLRVASVRVEEAMARVLQLVIVFPHAATVFGFFSPASSTIATSIRRMRCRRAVMASAACLWSDQPRRLTVWTTVGALRATTPSSTDDEVQQGSLLHQSAAGNDHDQGTCYYYTTTL